MKSGFILILALVTLVFIAGCTDKGQETTATTQSSNEQQQTTTTQTAVESKDTIEGLSSIGVLSFWKSWDADADNDGMLVGINFLDSKGDALNFEGIELTVDIQLYTSKLDENFKTVKDRLVYNGSAKIDSMSDANLIIGGIRVPMEEIKVDKTKDRQFGILEITVHTPKQGDFSARSELATLYE